VFKPREWRGTQGSSNPLMKEFNLSVEELAAEINSYTRGTIGYI